MPQYLWIRIAVVVAAIAASIWYLYPLGKTINLGLDLQGGIHLVLGVEVDKAVENTVERAAADLRGALEKKSIGVQATRQGSTGVLVQLNSPQAFNDAQAVLKDFTSFAIRSSDATAGRIELALTESEVSRLRDFAVRQAVETIRNRVDQFGVAEPTIQRQGENRILIQLPGVQDPARAKALIGKTALLEFKLLDEQADPEKARKDGPPPGTEVLYGRHVDRKTKTETKIPYVVRKRTLLTGDLIQTAEVRIGDSGEPYVSLTFNTTGARVFGELTEQNVGKRLAIVLDGNVHSAPSIRERIPSGQAQITGGFTAEEARDLAIVLRAGALPAPVQILEERTVGPSLGADSIRKGVFSTIAGAIVVVLFMMV
jgi:preprotein translocase subunit SecD